MSNDYDHINRDAVKVAPDHVKEDLNANPITGDPDSHPIGTGVGAAGGAAAGAAIGAIGGAGGKVAAEAFDPTLEKATGVPTTTKQQAMW